LKKIKKIYSSFLNSKSYLSSSGITNDDDPSLGLIKSNSRILQNEIPLGEKIINDIALDKTYNNLFTASSNSIKIWDLRQ
jgi:hypothetical protein